VRPSGGQFPVNQIYIPYSIFSPFGFNRPVSSTHVQR
jgi:hypothetical protein